MAKILVIDDEKSIRNTLQEILGYEGHQVTVAANGIEGLAALKIDKPDLILAEDALRRALGDHNLSPDLLHKLSDTRILKRGNGPIPPLIMGL